MNGGNRPRSPKLVSAGRTEINFSVEVFPIYLREKLLEREFLFSSGCGDNRPARNRYVQDRSFLDLGVFGQRLRESLQSSCCPTFELEHASAYLRLYL